MKKIKVEITFDIEDDILSNQKEIKSLEKHVRNTISYYVFGDMRQPISGAENVKIKFSF